MWVIIIFGNRLTRQQFAIRFTAKDGSFQWVYFMGTKQTHTPQSKPYHKCSTIKRPENDNSRCGNAPTAGLSKPYVLETFDFQAFYKEKR